MSPVTEATKGMAEAYYGDEPCRELGKVRVVVGGNGPNKIRNLTGVKAREFLIWINLTEICVEDGDDSPSPSGFITFKTLAGLSKSFPLSLFGGIGAQTLVFREEVDGSKEGNWCKKLKL
ncbi:hypothetical protein SLA2020_228030 [Shorea laevis]